MSLPQGGCGLVCGLCPFLAGFVGLSVVCVSSHRVVGWSVVLASSSRGLSVGLWSVSLPHGVVLWSVVCVSSSQGLWVCLWSLHLHRRGYWLISYLCLFLAWFWVGLCLFLTRVVDWSAFCVSSYPRLWVGLCYLPLPRGSYGLICDLCLFLARLLVCLWSVPLPCQGFRLVCGMCLFLVNVLGWSVVYVSSTRGSRVDLWLVSLPRVVVSWYVPLPHQGCGFVGWSVICVSSSRGMLVSMLYVSLLRGVSGLVFGLFFFLFGVVGWSVVCVSSSRGCGLVCVSSSRRFGLVCGLCVPHRVVG